MKLDDCECDFCKGIRNQNAKGTAEYESRKDIIEHDLTCPDCGLDFYPVDGATGCECHDAPDGACTRCGNSPCACDPVNHPSHYTHGIEVTDVIESWELGFHLGNVVKYICRYKHKNGIEDLRKAQWYLNRFLEKDNG